MKKIAVELQNYGSFDLFTRDIITTDEIKHAVSKTRCDEAISTSEGDHILYL